jgi:hypothetical protein
MIHGVQRITRIDVDLNELFVVELSHYLNWAM